MENIMIVDEKTTFREGLKWLIESKFGQFFKVIDTESKKLNQYENDPPKLIIIQEITNSKTERSLLEMRKQGTKVVLLSLEPDSFQDYLNFNIFDGFLLKKMPTQQLLSAIEGIIEQNQAYVHPDVGYQFYKKIVKNDFFGKTTCI